METSQSYRDEPIAIVGTACRFPGGCSSPSKLWDLYKQPRDVLSEIPHDRFNADRFYHPDPAHPGTSNVRHSYVLSEDHRLFDAQFFGVKASEASAMDPQHRILLEVAYEALEAAGQPLEHVQGSAMGVFVGLMSADYSDRLSQDINNVPTYIASGTARSTLSNRVSYAFDLQGPSMTIDTACSSSLVALHQAVSSLRRGESSPGAIVAGTNLLLSPEPYVAGAKLNMLSSSGRSKMWDKDADGYGRGDGFAVLVLKTLSRAIADNDHIECVIRETGVNQDGHTRGITMPSARAQESLIRATYARAGLDIGREEDRPQYFEAHGTGTPTGDPIEAEAISSVFFKKEDQRNDTKPSSCLYVGSGKTILGHSEGTAGVAGVLRATLALQNATIPPNLLLGEISPGVAPFYNRLKIVKEAKPWPARHGRPKRASVNSFGFGGTNAHAILESFHDHQKDENEPGNFIMPFTFSAASESSLKESLLAFENFLDENANTSLLDLAWTLSTRRTTLPSRISVAALDRHDLIAKLQEASNSAIKYASASTKDTQLLAIFTGQGAQWATMGASLLKYDNSFLKSRLNELQDALDTLPTPHAPSWTLLEELLKTPETSRIHEAEISQPLCTAIQILLVDLFNAAKIEISAVIGHSSGEIAAAYAAGFISGRDAVRIAYYRGYFMSSSSCTQLNGAMLAAGITPHDAKELCGLPTLEGRICVAARNSPTSVTLSGDLDAIQDAREILEDEGKFARLLRVEKAYHSHHMASPAQRYVEALEGLDIEVLSPCTSSLSLQRPVWISTVVEETTAKVMKLPLGNRNKFLLSAQYWGDNMVKPVFFHEAVEYYCQALGQKRQATKSAGGGGGPLHDLAIMEIGPHPALKKPTLDTVQLVLDDTKSDDEIPYISTLSRNCNDVEAFSQALGSLWTILGSSSNSAKGVDFNSLYTCLYSCGSSSITDTASHSKDKQPYRPPRVVKNLPTYSWQHDRVYWHESRHTKALRNGGVNSSQPNSLLGVVCPDVISTTVSGSNTTNAKRSELDWLHGHKVQGSVVFPAAGYIAAVMEAVGDMFGPQGSIQLVEVADFVITKALVFPDASASSNNGSTSVDGVETMLSMRLLKEEVEEHFTFFFSFSSDSNRSGASDTSFAENASGKVTVFLDAEADGNHDLLPSPSTIQPPQGQRFVDVNRQEFYTWAREIGYEYDGEFMGLINTRRRLDQASGDILLPRNTLLLHPAVLDCAIQSMLLAYCYPGDNRMRSLHMPTRIDRLSVDLTRLQEEMTGAQPSLPFQASVDAPQDDASRGLDIVGDAQVYSADQSRTLIQLQGLHITPLVKPSAKTDVKLFLDMTWGPQRPTGARLTWDDDKDFTELATTVISPHPTTLASLTERLAYYYIQRLALEFPPEKRATLDLLSSHHSRLLEYADHVVAWVESGTHPYVSAGAQVNLEVTDIGHVMSQYPSSIDLKVIKAVGEGLSSAIRGENNILEVMRQGDDSNSKKKTSAMMDDFYASSLGMPKYLQEVARLVGQISHRFAHMNILEIGAGSGATTDSVLGALDDAFSSYTFSDISSGYFAQARDRFSGDSDSRSNILFKVLDIEKDIPEQGFIEGSYDVVIASLVLHATRDLSATMSNVRRLLRPGGYLVLLEVTNNNSLRVGLVSGGLPGWWLGGEHDGRIMSPCVSAREWERIAAETGGFSPIEAMTPHDDRVSVPLSVLVLQAVDDRTRLLSDPLDHLCLPTTNIRPDSDMLTIVGGTAEAVIKLDSMLSKFYRHITHISSLEELAASSEQGSSALLSLVGLYVDTQPAIFQTMTRKTLEALQQVFREHKTILWVTSGARTGDSPYNNMLVGLQRSVALELRTGSDEEDKVAHSRVLDFDQHMMANSLSHSAFEIEEIIATRLLQIELEAALHANDRQLDELLWSTEPEQFVKGYEIQIPRLRAANAKNDRYNSARRPGLVRHVALNPADAVISVVRTEHAGATSAYSLEVTPHQEGLHAPRSHLGVQLEHLVTVRPVYSLLQPVTLAESGVVGYLSIAAVQENRLAIVLTDDLKSQLIIPPQLILDLPDSPSTKEDSSMLELLLSLQVHLLARRIVHARVAMVDHGTLAVLDPGEELGRALFDLFVPHSSQMLLLLTTKPPSSSALPWIHLHPRSTKSSIRRILPSNVSVFVDMTTSYASADSGGVSTLLLASLPAGCRTLRCPVFLADHAARNLSDQDPLRLQEATEVLKQAWMACLGSLDNLNRHTADALPLVTLDDIASKNIATGNFRIPQPRVLSWPSSTEESTISVPAQPASCSTQFSPSKTYWLAGLTSDLGLSLAEWMASRGARHIALSSRNPNVDPHWISYMAATHDGCRVKILHSYDATSRQSVEATHALISSTMPPIGGVAQGAMVLHDALFLNPMGSSGSVSSSYFDRFNAVLEPKVQGSMYLDEMFSQPAHEKQDLDFFIMFSSLAYVVGNRGQSAYTAANAFMASLAANRRKRGLAASVVHLGAIVGPGYVSRELTAEKRAVLHRSGFSFLSEGDFWEIFAEGVTAGRPNTLATDAKDWGCFEVAAGLRMDDEGDDKKTFWGNPIFQHLTRGGNSQTMADEDDKNGAGRQKALNVSLKVRLAGINSEVEGYKTALEHFVTKLEGTLALPPADNSNMGARRVLAKTPDELGIDSLVAVDMQSWFRKELGVDVPVMKILNAPSIQHLLSSAWELVDTSKSMPNLVPMVEVETETPSRPGQGIASLALSESAASNSISQAMSASTSDSMSTSGITSGITTPPEWSHISSVTSQAAQSASQTTASSTSGADEKWTSSHDIQRTLPMSMAQSRFWFLNFLVQDKSAFNVTTLIRLNSSNHTRLDGNRLEKAFIAVGQQHEAIRTLFYTDPGTKRPFQGILSRFPLRLEHSTLDGDQDDVTTQVQAELNDVRQHVFDLSRGETVRLKLLTVLQPRTSPGRDATSMSQHCAYYLILGYHHIVMDGISQQIFLSELAKAYEHPDSLHVPPTWGGVLQYPEHTIRQMHAAEQDSWAKEINYWRTQFSGNDLPPLLPHLPAFPPSHRGDSGVPSFSSHIVKGPIDPAIKAQVDQVCRRFRVSPSHFYLAVFRAFIFRHCMASHDDPSTSMDMCIGVGDAGRKDPDVQDSLGLFLNLLPLRFRQTESQMAFGDYLLPDTKRVSDLGFANSRLPIDVLVQKVAREAAAGNGGGLFQAFLNYRPPGIQDATTFLGCEAHGEMISAGGNSYDISVDILDSSGAGPSAATATMVMAVNEDMYTAADAEVLKQSYLALLAGFARDPTARIDQPALYIDQDIQEATGAGRGEERQVDASSGWPATVVHRIDDMVALYPDSVALTTVPIHSSAAALPDSVSGLGKDIDMTYSQMDSRIYQIASHLLDQLRTTMADDGQGDGRGPRRIAVLQAPGADRVCSLLAVLRIGVTCVPLESCSTERLVRIARESWIGCVLVDKTTKTEAQDWVASLQGNGTELSLTLIDVSSISPVASRNFGSEVPIQARPLDTALITYTSGSTTGTPRGVPTRHESLTNFLEFTPSTRWWPADPNAEQPQAPLTMLHQSSFAFDMSIAQILACLTHGGRLVIPAPSRDNHDAGGSRVNPLPRQDPSLMGEIILSRGVTFTMATPTEYTAWLRIGGDDIRRAFSSKDEQSRCRWTGAMSGGEPMTPRLVGMFRGVFNSAPFKLVNSYGPCETTFACADGLVSLDGQAKLEAGDPGVGGMSVLPNYTVQIVDRELNPVPCGVLGQVVIGGAGVARGYDGLPAGQGDKFRPSKQTPHCSPLFVRRGWTTEHFSGDLGSLDKQGRLTIYGRTSGQGSTQIKMGGVRMDLVEIEEAVLQTLAPHGVTEVVVSCRDTAYLVAFVVLDCHIKANKLRKVMERVPLPHYMRPSVVKILQAIPRTSSNKIDRARMDALPLQTADDSHPGNAVEKKSGANLEQQLLLLWAELLPGFEVGQSNSNHDFFRAGGNSLALLSLQALVKERLGVAVSVAELFGATSLAHMARLLREKSQKIHTEAVQVTAEELEGIIDWDQETAVPWLPAAVQSRSPFPTKPSHPPRVVGLTGATGHLGREMLRQLVDGIAHPHITHVHCLAVRTLPDTNSPTAPLKSASIVKNGITVTYHQGDLSLPSLGLSSSVAEQVIDSLDAIIHAGADVSFLKPYRALQPANVHSTSEIVRLAVSRLIPVHYISTAGVAGLTVSIAVNGPDTNHHPPQMPVSGYIASKWASEVLLERVSEQYGLPVVVHRPSYITAAAAGAGGNSLVGEESRSSDLTENMIQYAKKTGTVPDLSSWSGYFDSISLEKAADMILREALSPGSDVGTDNIRFVYESGETEVAVRDLGALIMKDMDTPSQLKVVPMEEWVDLVAEAGMNPLLIAYLRQSVVGKRLAFPRLVKSGRR
ncbi:acyl transferase/acyl hydrolase/lysophospholipase [Rhypophila decipiens]|uniref:Acyl transferase/acyl hydrolase/lysophospholipase n=1 Tax=Rhypophila decipiens TaxID=261697 RepID=A0AAN6Y4G3_9PEZI|nr:acyl transferase/acyl hydrolase/lysophospholipase [Rhypophila decipiens]